MEKYLHLYAEPEIAALKGLPDQESWSSVVVIPACNESPAFLRRPPPCDGRSLMILVINEPADDFNEVSLSNQKLAEKVHSLFELKWRSGPEFPGFELMLFQDHQESRDVLLVDRFSAGFQLPAKGGVGHARKIGADLAASLIAEKRIRSHWIHCTDGDVHLPETYFTCSHDFQDMEAYSALVYPYRHCDPSEGDENREVALATQLYEHSLRYYVAGLKFAGSPYAFHTIGSTMTVSARHYAMVRGFPKRLAGEDFYLLNKLAKVGKVLELDEGHACQAIRIEARRSDRVPFGTGAAVNQITALADPVKDFRFYNPEIFVLLKLWLEAMPTIWPSQSSNLATSDLREQEFLLNGLIEIGAEKALDHAFRQSKDLEQFMKQMVTWFDAFRTLKLVHYLRDHHLPSISHEVLLSSEAYQLLNNF